jgi:hypothetical protein
LVRTKRHLIVDLSIDAGRRLTLVHSVMKLTSISKNVNTM